MHKVTTARILAEKALGETCGQSCVDWAITVLAAGREGRYLGMLAGMNPPFNHFEVADFRDRVLKELEIPDLPLEQVLKAYAAERLQNMLDGKEEMGDVLKALEKLCVLGDYVESLYDFYLLHHARIDLRDSTMQWYWPGATRENINAVIRVYAEQFIADNFRTWRLVTFGSLNTICLP